MSKSIFTDTVPDGVMYHCIPVSAQGDCIRASDGYGTMLSPAVVAALGDYKAPDKNNKGGTPLVFASRYLSKALSFALRDEKILNTGIAGTEAEMVLVCDRDRTMARKLDATVYSFSDKGFVDLDPGARQSVSLSPVPFAQTKVVAKIDTMQDLMRAGLQVFSFAENFKQHGGYEAANKDMTENGWNFDQYLGNMIKQGRVVWENHARGISPHPVLQERLAEYLKTAPSAEQKMTVVKHHKNQSPPPKPSM